MNIKNQKTNLLLLYFPYLLFFVLGVVYLYGFTTYIFFYQEKAALFQTTFAFFSEKMQQPGGFLNYLGEFQTALYYYPLLGAIVLTLEMTTVMILVTAIGKKMTGKPVFVLPFLLGGALFFLQTHYQFRSFTILGIVLQLLFFFLIIKNGKGKTAWLPVVLFPLNYYLFGSFSFLFLAMFVFWLVQYQSKHRWLKIAGILVWQLLFFYIGKELVFFQPIGQLLVFPYSSAKTGEQVPLFTAVLVLVATLPLLFLLKPKVMENIGAKRFLWLQLVPVALLIVLALVCIQRIDKKNSHYFYVEKLFYQQKYDEIIAFNSQSPSNNILTNYLNNIALAETGQLGDRLFQFPQSTDGGTLFLKWDLLTEVLKRGGYYYYTLGVINEAQRWAYEFMVMRGLTPEGLKMLIKTELINGNYKVAQKYISILKNTLFYKKEAQDFEQLLFDDEAVNRHPELGRKKALKTKQDFFVLSEEPAANIDWIIAADSTNYAAVEYKLALLMLQKDMAQIVEMLPVLEKCGFRKIPKNVEEAVVAYQQLKLGEIPELQRLRINQETVQRFRQYYRVFQENSANREQAQRALARDFSDTFWYYVFFS